MATRWSFSIITVCYSICVHVIKQRREKKQARIDDKYKVDRSISHTFIISTSLSIRDVHMYVRMEKDIHTSIMLFGLHREFVLLESSKDEKVDSKEGSLLHTEARVQVFHQQFMKPRKRFSKDFLLQFFAFRNPFPEQRLKWVLWKWDDDEAAFSNRGFQNFVEDKARARWGCVCVCT